MFYQATLANTVSAINVAITARHATVTVPVTRFSISVIERLVDIGVLYSFKYVKDSMFPRKAELHIAYSAGRPAITRLRIISTGAKTYTIQLRTMLKHANKFDGYTVLLTTSRGILTINEAIQKKVGGQALIEVLY